MVQYQNYNETFNDTALAAALIVLYGLFILFFRARMSLAGLATQKGVRVTPSALLNQFLPPSPRSDIPPSLPDQPHQRHGGGALDHYISGGHRQRLGGLLLHRHVVRLPRGAAL